MPHGPPDRYLSICKTFLCEKYRKKLSKRHFIAYIPNSKNIRNEAPIVSDIMCFVLVFALCILINSINWY